MKTPGFGNNLLIWLDDRALGNLGFAQIIAELGQGRIKREIELIGYVVELLPEFRCRG